MENTIFEEMFPETTLLLKQMLDFLKTSEKETHKDFKKF